MVSVVLKEFIKKQRGTTSYRLSGLARDPCTNKRAHAGMRERLPIFVQILKLASLRAEIRNAMIFY